MPVFCFTTKSGRTVERVFHCGKAPNSVTDDGERAYRDIPAEHRGFRNVACAIWPTTSLSAAVELSERREAEKFAEAAGVPTRFVDTEFESRPVFENRSHRKRYLKARGYHDNDGGYGD